MFMFSNRGNRNFGRGRDFKKPSFGRRDTSDRTMYRTTCAKCGNDCEVPFKPTGERPVYCNQCFDRNRNSEPRRSDDRNSSGFSEDKYKKQFDALNWKLDKILKIISPVVTPVTPNGIPTEKIEKKILVFKPKKLAKVAKKERDMLSKKLDT